MDYPNDQWPLIFIDTPVFPALAPFDHAHVVRLPLHIYDPSLTLGHAIGTLLHNISASNLRAGADRDFMDLGYSAAEIAIKPRDNSFSLHVRRKGREVFVRATIPSPSLQEMRTYRINV
jgi:hypothetical protein